MKRPSFQFYPGDWRRDPALQACSVGARGAWMELMCLMHESSEYGVLTINGATPSDAVLARLIGSTHKEISLWIAELDANGVFSRDDKGRIYSRRMIRDEAIRNERARGGFAGKEHGHKGGSYGIKGGRPTEMEEEQITPLIPPLVTPLNGHGYPPLKPPPSSSSSSSSSEVQKHSRLSALGFDQFWAIWPSSPRKGSKSKCLAVWLAKKYEESSDEIVAHVETMKQSDDWRKGFICAPLVYLNQAKWEGASTAPEERRFVI